MKLTHPLCIMTFLAASIAFSQPKLSLDNLEVDFGTMYSGAKKKGKIVLKNIGNDTLRIHSVQPQCGCTAVKQPKQFLLPGQSDIVELEFNSAGYRGKVEKQVSINTNDPTSQYVSVKLLIDVIEILQPLGLSNMLWLNNAIIGKETSQIMKLKNVSGTTLAIQGDSLSSPALAVKMENKILLPNDTLAIQVTVLASKLGYSTEIFYIKTNHKIQPLVELRAAYMGIKEN